MWFDSSGFLESGLWESTDCAERTSELPNMLACRDVEADSLAGVHQTLGSTDKGRACQAKEETRMDGRGATSGKRRCPAVPIEVSGTG